MHTPVLLKQVIKNLEIKGNGKYIDATVGRGGHVEEILKKGPKVLAIDIDNYQAKALEKKSLSFPFKENLKIVVGNFSEIENIARINNFFPVDGILFDLGISYDQLSLSGRGFSYKMKQEELDMRLTNRFKICAKDVVNSLNKEELYEIFARNSEEINSRTIAENIIRARSMKKIITVNDLVKIVDRAIKRHDESVLSRIFQSLRMHVNKEIENLKKALNGSLNIVKRNGRIIIISFHSIEDRIIKNFVKENSNKVYQLLLIKGDRQKSFERSAKLRVLIRS